MQVGRFSQVHGLEGSGTFRFEGTTEGGRSVAVEVAPEVILSLAIALNHTKSVGHAAWHVQRKQPFEGCSSCDRVAATASPGE